MIAWAALVISAGSFVTSVWVAWRGRGQSIYNLNGKRVGRRRL